ncbi:MAG TPA: hypothetical protein VGB78_09985 [Thermoplasmata archaeon]|jgi:uncharacterized membrane protein YvbJ
MARKLIRQKCPYCGCPVCENDCKCPSCGNEVGPQAAPPGALSRLVDKTNDYFLGPTYLRLIIAIAVLVVFLTVWIVLTLVA